MAGPAYDEAFLDAARHLFWDPSVPKKDKDIWGLFVARYYFSQEDKTVIINEIKQMLSKYLRTQSKPAVRKVVWELIKSSQR